MSQHATNQGTLVIYVIKTNIGNDRIKHNEPPRHQPRYTSDSCHPNRTYAMLGSNTKICKINVIIESNTMSQHATNQGTLVIYVIKTNIGNDRIKHKEPPRHQPRYTSDLCY